MSWIGKIFAVLAVLLALAWMWLTVSVFATRTNWKTQAEQNKDAFTKAVKARQDEYQTYLTEKDALERQLAAERSRVDGLTKQVADLRGANETVSKENAKLAQDYKNSDVQAKQLQANVQASLDESAKLRERNTGLEDERQKLVLARETAEKERLAAQNDRKQMESKLTTAEQKVDQLQAENTELRQFGNRPPTAADRLNKPAAAPPEGLRGSVEKYQEGLIQVNIGLDAGVTTGMILDVYRSGDGGRYLGTVRITHTWPKQAVGTFIPSAAGRSVRQLRPEELPKKGDTVGKIGNVNAGR